MSNVQSASGPLYLGIDLGTSRTSVAASNGVRETIASYVGYPKDAIASKKLGKDVLYGDEAIANRLSLKLYRPLAHGVIQTDHEGSENVRAATDLIKEIIKRARPLPGQKVYAVIGAPAQASLHNKQAILDAARESVNSVMLCSEPFSVAYGLDMLDDVLVVDIGAGTTDLCRMHGTMPEDADQITSTFAGDHVDAVLMDLISKHCQGAQFTKEMVKTIKEKHASVLDQMPAAFVKLPVAGKPTEFDITEHVKTACRSIVPGIVDGIQHLVASFDPEFQDRLKGRVLLAGGGSMIRGLDHEIEKALQERLGSGRVVRIEEPIYGGANGALKLAFDMPTEYWEQLK